MRVVAGMGVCVCVFFFVRLTAGKCETFAATAFFEPWKWLGSSMLVSETHGNIACC